MSDEGTRARDAGGGSSPDGPVGERSGARDDAAQRPGNHSDVRSTEPEQPAPRAAKFTLFVSGPDVAWRDWRSWAGFVAIIVLGIVLDLGSKWWAFEHVAEAPAHPVPAEVMLRLAHDPATVGLALPPHDPMPVVPGVLDFFLVLNPGAVFGAGPGQRWAFISFTGVTLLFAVYVFACWTRRGQWLTQGALAMVIAGGVGNLYDRVTLGVVRDFLHFFPGTNLPFGLRWPSGNAELWPYISNVADKFVLFGIAVLMVKLWRVDRAAAQAAKEARNSG